jgi:drug/metabolite transporter (DMT)-like permease
VLGLVLGIGGILLLLAAELGAAGRSPLGAALMLSGAATWATGVVMLKRWAQMGMPATAFSAWTLLLGAVPVLCAVPFEEGSFLPEGMSAAAMGALAYNVLVAFVLAYWAWIRVVRAAPVAVSSLSTLIVPVIGVFSGMIVLGERPQATDFAALALVVAALAAVLLGGSGEPARRKR